MLLQSYLYGPKVGEEQIEPTFGSTPLMPNPTGAYSFLLFCRYVGNGCYNGGVVYSSSTFSRSKVSLCTSAYYLSMICASIFLVA